jgi:hypothetical protein
MSSEETTWLAGLLEGEGCFCVDKVTKNGRIRHYPTIRLNMTDFDVVERASRAIAEIASTLPHSAMETKRPAGRQTQWKIVYRGRAAVDTMRVLRSMMGVRRGARIDEILEEAA